MPHGSLIAVHRMWQEIQNCNSISESLELALSMIGNDEIVKYASNNKSEIIEQCLKALPDWGVWQDECLSQNRLLYDYLIADKLEELCEGREEL